MEKEKEHINICSESDAIVKSPIKLEHEEETSVLDLAKESENNTWDTKYRKMEKEDALIFGSDSWLKHCVEMEEEENKPHVPLLIKIKNKEKNVGKFLNENLKSSLDFGKENEDESSNNWTKDKTHSETGKQRKVNVSKRGDHNKTKNQESLPLIMRNAPVENTETYGKCTFECSVCYTIFKSWRGFARHMTSDHKRRVRLSEWKTFAQNVSVHICRICSQKELCDTVFTTNHLRTVHGITTMEYNKKYITDCSWILYEEMLKTGRMSENVIGNHCTFKCPTCERIFTCHPSFRRHCVKDKICCVKHLKHLSEYIQKVVVHKCKICSKVILCSRQFLRAHIYFHGIKTLSAYAEKTGCLLEDNCLRSKDTFAFDRVTLGAKVSKQVGNFCRYTCGTCSHITSMWRYMRVHLQRTGHGTSETNKWFKCISKTVLHQCLICDKKVLNGTEFVKDHVSKAHKKTLLQYLKEYNVTQGKD